MLGLVLSAQGRDIQGGETVDLKAFMDDFMNMDDLKLLTRDAGLLFNCPVMVVDMAFQAVSWHAPSGFEDRPFNESVARGSLTYETGGFLIGTDRRAHFVTLEDSPHRRRFSLLVTGGTPVGYLILVDTENRLKAMDPELFAQVESALAKQLLLEVNRGSAMKTTEESVLQHLLEGKFSDEQMFELQAATAGLRYFAPRRVAIINLELYRSANWSENALRSNILDRFPMSKPMIHRGAVVFFLNSDPDMALFESFSKQFSLRIVLSAPIPRLFKLPEYYAAALSLMEVLLSKFSRPFVVLYESCQALMLLKGVRGDYVLPEVRALGERDRREETLYCLTLYTYLCCHHSLQETCERLYTHKNTVLYRVRRMREDFQIPIDDPDQHLALMLSSALMLMELGQEDLLVPGL